MGVTSRAMPKNQVLPAGWCGERATPALESSGQPASRRRWVAHRARTEAPSTHGLFSPNILRGSWEGYSDKRLRAEGTDYHKANRTAT